LTCPANAQVKWQTSFEAAKKAAAASGKPICIDFMATWCGPCRKMDEETFSDPRIQALLKKMELVRLDVDNRPAQAKTYGVNAIPRLIVLPSGGGRPHLDLQGYCDAEELAGQLRSALGLSPQDVAPTKKAAEEVNRVGEALANHTYPALKATDPKAAAAGLDKLMEQLGAAKEADFKEALKFVRLAGDDAVPAFIRGLDHPHLAVRAGCYRALQETFKNAALPPYDAWAPARVRKAQAAKWNQWLATQKPLKALER
jgi:thioredoxin-like negative regulator of GroEL